MSDLSTVTMLGESLPEPQFIERDPAAITAAIIAKYEADTGKTLYPAQAERLLIDVIAYRESILRVGIQDAAKQNLLSYATGVMLDYLGELVGCYRLPAQYAKTTIQFTFAAPLAAPLLIPQGTIINSSNGNAAFATDDDLTVAAGVTQATVTATADEAGIVGNGYAVGQISTLDDDLSVECAVTNITATDGGAETETDDHFKRRIKLAPESYSNAGSEGAYKYHAQSAHQSVEDVAVISPTPGYVQLYPLVKNQGVTALPSTQIIDLVLAQCNGRKTRPLTDNVTVLSPIPVDYQINAALTLYTTADAASTLAAANQAAIAYKANRAAGLGRDIVPLDAAAALKVAGVYNVVLTGLPSIVVLADNQWARCTGIAVTVAGTANG